MPYAVGRRIFGRRVCGSTNFRSMACIPLFVIDIKQVLRRSGCIPGDPDRLLPVSTYVMISNAYLAGTEAIRIWAALPTSYYLLPILTYTYYYLYLYLPIITYTYTYYYLYLYLLLPIPTPIITYTYYYLYRLLPIT
jgi:hypothetical protein